MPPAHRSHLPCIYQPVSQEAGFFDSPSNELPRKDHDSDISAWEREGLCKIHEKGEATKKKLMGFFPNESEWEAWVIEDDQFSKTYNVFADELFGSASNYHMTSR